MVRDSFAGLRSPQRGGENLNSLTLWGGGKNGALFKGKVFSFLKTQFKFFQNFYFENLVFKKRFFLFFIEGFGRSSGPRVGQKAALGLEEFDLTVELVTCGGR